MSELLGLLPVLMIGLMMRSNFLSSLAAIGGMVGGAIGGHKARGAAKEVQKAREWAWWNLMNEFKAMSTERRAALKGGYEPLRQQLEMLKEAVFRSNEQITEVGQAGMQDIRDQTMQAVASAGASMQNRGLFNTTGFDQARMQGAYQGNRAVADLSGQIAGVRSQNTLRGAGMLGQGYRDLSNYSLSEFSGLGDIFGQRLAMSESDPFLHKGMPRSGAGAAYGTAGAQIGGFLEEIDWDSLFNPGGSGPQTGEESLLLGF